MSHLRNPRLFRIMEAMEAKKDSSCSKEPKQISMEELDYNNYTRDANPIAEEICRSPSLLPEEQTLPQTVNTTEEECFVHPCPSSRARTDSTSSESSSSSSSTSSTSSSSSSASESGKDFSPDEADRDPDYTLPAPPRRASFSPTPINKTPEQLVEEYNLGLPEENQISNNLNPPNLNPDPIPISTNLGLPEPEENQILKKRKRKGHKSLSVRQNAQKLRNSGQQYTSVSKLKKVIPQKQMGPPCGVKCRLKCSEIIKQEDRENIFDNYWKMGDLTRQRDYISKCIDVIKPKYQYKVHNSNRGPKHSFSFEIDKNKRRVCKIFFKNTLNINNRPIATVIEKKNQLGIVEEEKRGKHGKQKKVSSDIIQGIKNHIDSIPRIESHYLRQQTTREYIDGGKNLTDIYNDYEKKCLNDGVEAAKIHTFRKVFNEEYNISFFVPKKDQCETCVSYMNSDKTTEIQNNYEQHQLEKELCRQEKSNDKAMVQDNYIVACYDLQAVLPLPKGDISTLYYKCKLNVCNFTISELAKDSCDCFVWSEVEALRGANEIATCVWRYLKKKCERESEINDNNLQITFYSDNCCGQQKNKFMFSLYLYALSVLNIKSITHKYLISGHTQNENDSVHSVIEKAVKKCLRSGPIYTPDQYVAIIRTARKKGNPYNVTEMCYSDFVDIKNITEACGGQFSKNTQGETVRLTDIKVIKFEKHQDSDNIAIYYKTSYTDTDFKEIQYHNSRVSRTRATQSLQNYQLKPLYQSRLKLSDRKNSDLKSLINSNVIPQSYALSYYNSILF